MELSGFAPAPTGPRPSAAFATLVTEATPGGRFDYTYRGRLLEQVRQELAQSSDPMGLAQAFGAVFNQLEATGVAAREQLESVRKGVTDAASLARTQLTATYLRGTLAEAARRYPALEKLDVSSLKPGSADRGPYVEVREKNGRELYDTDPLVPMLQRLLSRKPALLGVTIGNSQSGE